MTRAPRAQRIQLAIVERVRSGCDRAFLNRVVTATLAFCERSEIAVSLLLTDDEEIAAIHGEYLDDPTPTDVISFALGDEAELAISVETARRLAKEHGHTLRAELALYVVHGLLHCCGFDDMTARERRAMRAAEREVMRRLRLRVQHVDT